jgi:hypothetical protein
VLHRSSTLSDACSADLKRTSRTSFAARNAKAAVVAARRTHLQAVVKPWLSSTDTHEQRQVSDQLRRLESTITKARAEIIEEGWQLLVSTTSPSYGHLTNWAGSSQIRIPVMKRKLALPCQRWKRLLQPSGLSTDGHCCDSRYRVGNASRCRVCPTVQGW